MSSMRKLSTRSAALIRPLTPLLIVALLTSCSGQQSQQSEQNALNARDIFYHADSKTSAQSATDNNTAAATSSFAYSLELRRGDEDPVPCDNRFTFKSGDAIKLRLKVNQPLYAVIIETGSTGEISRLFPPPGEDGHLEPGKVLTIPQEGEMVFDDNPGKETILIGLSQNPLSDKGAGLKGPTITAEALNGQAAKVGEYSVFSGFGNTYELGKQPQGDGLVYVSAPKRDQEIIVGISLKHSKDGEALANDSTGSADQSDKADTADKTNKTGSSDKYDKLQSQLTGGDNPHVYGIVPPYMLEEIAKRNPGMKDVRDTLAEMRSLETHPLPAPSDLRDGEGNDAHGAREVYDAQEQERIPGEKLRFEGESPCGRYEADQIYDLTGQVRDFYQECFGRNSIDGKGMKCISTQNFRKNFTNAFWDGSQMVYGVPGPDSPFATFVLIDVIGHEITHGVTEKEQPLEYWGQSGALNESISDVFGELVKQKSQGTPADQADWIVGKGCWKNGFKGDGIRNMLHPGTAFDDPRLGKDTQPDHMNNYLKTSSDRGGVHLNSGIPNRAFVLFAIDEGGNAWEKPAKIWFEARAQSSNQSSFAQFAYHTIEAAKKLGYDDDVPKLEKAWSDVGVTPDKDQTDTLTPPRS